MSKELCVAFYGVRYEPSESELEALETRVHPLLKSARRAKLDVFWGNFAGPGEKYYVFIGGKIGVLGPENASEVQLSEDEMLARVEESNRKLKEAGIAEAGQFYLQWMPQ